METIAVRGFTVIRDIFGSSTVDVDAAAAGTVSGVLEALLARFGDPLRSILCEPGSGEITPFPIRLNDELISSALDGDRRVEPGDEMTIIFPVGGG